MLLICQKLDHTVQTESVYGVFGYISDMYQQTENSHPDKPRFFYRGKKKKEFKQGHDLHKTLHLPFKLKLICYK